MQYEIQGGAYPIVVCRLQSGEQMITEKGSMVYMTPNMQMETRGGGIGKMFSKALSGESMFQNIYTAKGDGVIAFGSSFPGRILPLEITPERPDDPAKERLFGGRAYGRACHHLQEKIGRRLFWRRRVYHAAAVAWRL